MWSPCSERPAPTPLSPRRAAGATAARRPIALCVAALPWLRRSPAELTPGRATERDEADRSQAEPVARCSTFTSPDTAAAALRLGAAPGGRGTGVQINRQKPLRDERCLQKPSGPEGGPCRIMGKRASGSQARRVPWAVDAEGAEGASASCVSVKHRSRRRPLPPHTPQPKASVRQGGAQPGATATPAHVQNQSWALRRCSAAPRAKTTAPFLSRSCPGVSQPASWPACGRPPRPAPCCR